MKTVLMLAASAFNILGFVLLTPSVQAAAPRLLPFQGRLTDASGTPVADGAKVVQFKIYDAPTGGTAVWNGEVQKVTVNGGLVSTLLGSKADLSAVDFNQALYLEITVDANADNQITAADPPLLPRQSILPAVFAVEAQSAREAQRLKATDGTFHDWSALFGAQNPSTGSIAASRISFPAGSISASVIAANDSITASQLASNSVDSSEIKNGAVTSLKIGGGEVNTLNLAGSVDGTGLETTPGAVTSAKIKDGTIAAADLATGSVTWPKLALRSLSPGNVGGAEGDVGQGVLASNFASNANAFVLVPMTARIVTRGRPVFVGILPVTGSAVALMRIGGNPTNGPQIFCKLVRDGTSDLGVVDFGYNDSQSNVSRFLDIPPGSIWTIDVPAAGSHTYELKVNPSGYDAQIQNVRIIAFEL